VSAISFEGHVAAAQTTLALQSAAPTGTSGFVAEDPQMQQSSFERGDISVTGKSVRKTCELCQLQSQLLATITFSLHFAGGRIGLRH
jgi:hypothetical protein